MNNKKANLNVRMNPDLLEKFREVVEKNEFSTPLEVVRGWIERYVSLGSRYNDPRLEVSRYKAVEVRLQTILDKVNSEMSVHNHSLTSEPLTHADRIALTGILELTDIVKGLVADLEWLKEREE